MANDPSRLRGTVLSEDTRPERFFRQLLSHLGFNLNKLRFRTAPKGRGDAKAWVRAESQYPAEVALVRRKPGQNIFVIAILDGDNASIATRKAELDQALVSNGLGIRAIDERIATPIPKWSIETWLLALTGYEVAGEDESLKINFERAHSGIEERNALREAAAGWRANAENFPSVPSLADSKGELARLDR
jgi:hypothetical protein